MTKASDNLFPGIIIRESANDGSDFTNPAADYRRLFVGEDGLFHLKDSAGTVTTPAFGNPMTTAGDVIYGGASGVATRLAIGTAGQVLTVNGGATAPEWAAAAGGSTELLGYVAHTAGDEAPASATMGDLDATNAAVTFTAPASGDVLVRLSATAHAGPTLNAFQTWGLRESTSDIAGAAGESIAVRNGTADSSAQFLGVTKVFVLTGIAGGSHTYKWAVAQSTGTGALKANANSPAVMEVWSLP